MNILKALEFLRDKRGKQVPLLYKLLYAPETINGEEDLHIKENLLLIGAPLESLPDNLTVDGAMDISHSQIKSLPKNLTVGIYLDVSFTPISEIPENLHVDGFFNCKQTPLAKQVPFSKYDPPTKAIAQMIREKGGSAKYVSIY